MSIPASAHPAAPRAAAEPLAAFLAATRAAIEGGDVRLARALEAASCQRRAACRSRPADRAEGRAGAVVRRDPRDARRDPQSRRRRRHRRDRGIARSRPLARVRARDAACGRCRHAAAREQERQGDAAPASARSDRCVGCRRRRRRRRPRAARPRARAPPAARPAVPGRARPHRRRATGWCRRWRASGARSTSSSRFSTTRSTPCRQRHAAKARRRSASSTTAPARAT